ncbi:MAG TPA: response regulator transcription factor [Bryobacteraceae bacterium]|jgi:DNA-binding response OmpR family regulator|nr:response regulator transcription factor [Bryobacteraceae bacterium]
MRILIVEDEPRLALAVKQGLEANDHAVTIARTGEEGFFLVQTQIFDLLILDLMLPGRDGLEILASLRRLGVRTPVLLLTAKSDIEDKIRGLDAGADDYLGKPFALSELQARVRALGRRGTPEPTGTLKVEDLELDRLRHIATRAGKPLDLTAREFELLEYFMHQPDQVVSREALARDVWKETARHSPIDNLIDVHIARLRRKLADPGGQKLLHTIRGVGFVLRMEPVQ